jgi:ssDNA thymidine ADP-ribosyltransferase, DarT
LGISTQLAKEHISNWESDLKLSAVRRHKSKWPRYLFRHEKLENAAKVLEAGQLLSRNAAANQIHDDIAPATVIARRADARQFARLYFRPKNPTQMWVEGIRQTGDPFLNNDLAAHAPVLVMLVFRAESVLTKDTTYFSDGNMQHAKTKHDKTEEFFKCIPFADVFHDERFDPDERERIVRARCAEVLAQSPLDLSEHLVAVLCRSEAERRTLLRSGNIFQQLFVC